MSPVVDLPFVLLTADHRQSEELVCDNREVFHRLINYNEFASNQQLARNFLTRHFEIVNRQYRERFTRISEHAATRLTVEVENNSSLSGGHGFADSLQQSAPVLLTEPCWLQDVCQAATNQDATAATLLRVYRALCDSELQTGFKALLLQSGFELPVLYTENYSRRTDLLEEFIEFAALQLALATSPVIYDAELLGFTLAYCRSPTVLESCFPNRTAQIDYFKKRQSLLSDQVALIESAIDHFLRQEAASKEERWQRIQAGFWLYKSSQQRCIRQLFRRLGEPRSSSRQMADLLCAKAGAALGHHRKILLRGKNLDEWFKKLPEGAEEMLEALRRSPYVDPERPENSRLLRLFATGGPMIGVLDRSEVAIIKRWLLDGLPVTIGISAKDIHKQKINRYSIERTSSKVNFARMSNRQLFYYLINADRYPEVLPQAEAKASRWLQRFAVLGSVPFKQYSHRSLEQYLQGVYRREMDAYRALNGKPKISREAYRWGLLQAAPTVLIDGAWLQHCNWLQYAHPDIAAILTGIYADEVGNGMLAQSHPVVYRKLLEQLGFGLPQVHFKAFSEFDGFVDSAFDLPVLMLLLGRFPRRFLPELLGLNMAIELNGLGRVYLRMVDELDYWGIDSTIARLHITIDNFASGHSAQAQKAIALYLDEVRADRGERAMQHKWRRIFNGYNSLKMVSWRFKLAVPTVYVHHKLTRLLRFGPE